MPNVLLNIIKTKPQPKSFKWFRWSSTSTIYPDNPPNMKKVKLIYNNIPILCDICKTDIYFSMEDQKTNVCANCNLCKTICPLQDSCKIIQKIV